MARTKGWHHTAGETVDLGKSLGADLDAGELLTGTPVVTIHAKETGADVTTDFTIANEQVNSAPFTTEAGEVVPIGEGVLFRLTMTDTPGSYVVRISCGADDGSTPAATPPVPLLVSGPAAP